VDSVVKIAAGPDDDEHYPASASCGLLGISSHESTVGIIETEILNRFPYLAEIPCCRVVVKGKRPKAASLPQFLLRSHPRPRQREGPGEIDLTGKGIQRTGRINHHDEGGPPMCEVGVETYAMDTPYTNGLGRDV
jgi:hypothetical protein